MADTATVVFTFDTDSYIAELSKLAAWLGDPDKAVEQVAIGNTLSPIRGRTW